MKNEELQKRVMQFQFMEANLRSLQERAQLVTNKLEDAQRTILAIDDLEKTKPNKSLIPIGEGNFVEGSIENTNEIFVGVGMGVVLKKSKAEAKQMLEEKIQEFEKILQDIATNAQNILTELQKIQEEIRKLQE